MRNNMQLLAHLALRPSCQQLLRTRGFVTVQEVVDSHQAGGLTNLAAELGTDLGTAVGVWYEILQQQQMHIQQVPPTETTVDDDQTCVVVAGGVGREKDNQQLAAEGSVGVPKENQQQPPTSTAMTTAAWTHHRRPRTAQQLLHDNNNNSKSSIITFCRDLDQLLQGGICLGELTELAGPPGAGKTQWAMQLAVNCRLPVAVGGVNGEACYIDTEGSFGPERCFQLAVALAQHVAAATRRRQITTTAGLSLLLSPETMLQGIHVIRIHDLSSLQATLEGTVPQLARDRAAAGSPLRLVVVDSMAFPVRAEVPPDENSSDFYVTRTRQLTVLAQQLAQLAARYGLAAVAINQMTTQLRPAVNRSSSSSSSSWPSSSHANNSTNNVSSCCLVPALGESWAHAVTTRLVLSSTTSMSSSSSSSPHNSPAAVAVRRICTLVKSPRLPNASAEYQVLEEGVRGADFRPRVSRKSSSSSSDIRHDDDSNKRPRGNDDDNEQAP